MQSNSFDFLATPATTSFNLIKKVRPSGPTKRDTVQRKEPVAEQRTHSVPYANALEIKLKATNQSPQESTSPMCYSRRRPSGTTTEQARNTTTDESITRVLIFGTLRR